MRQDYVEILGRPIRWKPTPELRWFRAKEGKVLQQLWRAEYSPLIERIFNDDPYYREEWRDVPE